MQNTYLMYIQYVLYCMSTWHSTNGYSVTTPSVEAEENLQGSFSGNRSSSDYIKKNDKTRKCLQEAHVLTEAFTYKRT